MLTFLIILDFITSAIALIYLVKTSRLLESRHITSDAIKTSETLDDTYHVRDDSATSVENSPIIHIDRDDEREYFDEVTAKRNRYF